MKALISGAGIAGLAAGLALARNGWDVHIVEKASGLRANGYMIDFFGPGFEAAERLGIINALSDASHAIDLIEFVDGQGQRSATINYKLAREAANGKLFPIMRGDVERVLHAALPASITISYGTEIEALSETNDAVTATLSNGDSLAADLMIGADGIHSRTRARLFGPGTNNIRFLHHHTAAYVFESETVRRALGGAFRMLAVPGRQAGFYDTGDGQLRHQGAAFLSAWLLRSLRGIVDPPEPLLWRRWWDVCMLRAWGSVDSMGGARSRASVCVGGCASRRVSFGCVSVC